VYFYAMITKMFHHPQSSLENYMCDMYKKNTKMCNNSQSSLGGWQATAIG